MGYYKEQEIAAQADADRMVAWWHANADQMPKYLYDWLMERDERIWSVIQAWENEPLPPKPATDHVALLWESRKVRRQLEKASRVVSFTQREYSGLVAAVSAFAIAFMVTVVWLVSVL